MVDTVPQPVAESRRMISLYLAAGAVFATIAARGLTVPLYAHELGASRFAVGALFSVATIAAALLSLPSGVLVDRFGARNLLAVSLVLTAVSQLATAFTPSVAPLFLWQIVGGLAAGIQQSAIFSAVTESVDRARLGRAMGWLTLSMQAGYLLALQAVVNGVSRVPAGRLVDRLPQRWPIVFVGAVGWSVVMVVLGHLNGFLAPALVLAIGTPFMAAAFVAMGVVFADLSNASTRGVTMGMYGTILFLGLSAGPLIFGPVVQGYGYAAGFTACAVAAMMLVLVMAAMHREQVRRRTEQAPLGDSETRAAATRRA